MKLVSKKQRVYVIKHGGNTMGKEITKIKEELEKNPNEKVSEILHMIKNPPKELDGTKLCCKRLIDWKWDMIKEIKELIGIK